MKITFIQPPIRDFYITKMRMTPLGLIYLASFLKGAGYNTEILDFFYPDTKSSIPFPKEMEYLKRYYVSGDKSPFRMFSSYYHFGLSFEKIREKIRSADSEIYCVSTMMTPYINESIRIAEIIREEKPGSVIIAGGAHATLVPENLVKSGVFDYIIRGEAEESLLKLINALTNNLNDNIKNIEGLCFKTQDGKFLIQNPVYIKNPDEILYDDVDITGRESYFFDNRKIFPVLFSRGCPHHCRYCSVWKLGSMRYRTRSPRSVVNEMLIYHKNMNIKVFDFEDDNLTFDQKKAAELFNMISSSFSPDENIECTAMNGITASSLNPEILELMKKAYFKSLNLALISSDQNLQKKWERPFNEEKFAAIVDEAQRLAFCVTGYQIVGMPGQSVPEMISTFSFMKKLPLKIGVSVYYPIPGTPMYEKCVNDNLINKESFSLFRSSALPVETKEFCRDDIFTFLIAARIHNFMKDNNILSCYDEKIKYDIVYDTKIRKNVLIYEGNSPQHDIPRILLEIFKRDKILYSLKEISRRIAKETAVPGKEYFEINPLPVNPAILNELI